MKNVRMAVAVIAVAALGSAPVYVWGHGNEHGTATLTLSGGKVSVDYGRPTLKGRDVFSMIQAGSYWRMGADRATVLTTEMDLTFGEQTVPKGQYTLVAHFVGEGKWAFVVAEGATRGSWEPQGVVAEVAVTVDTTSSSVEMLTIKLEGGGSDGRLVLEWGTTRMTAAFVAS